jgi:lysozyme
MKISQRGIQLIKDFEGLRLKAYKCPADVWTIGYGHTEGVKPGDVITVAQAESFLMQDLARFQRGVNKAVNVPIFQGQYDALVSFAFNLGIGALQSSTLLRKLNAGLDASVEFGRWVNAGGKKLDGLVRRREAERVLFIGG